MIRGLIMDISHFYSINLKNFTLILKLVLTKMYLGKLIEQISRDI